MRIDPNTLTGTLVPPVTEQWLDALVDLANNEKAEFCGARIVKNHGGDFSVTLWPHESQCHCAREAVNEAALLAERVTLQGWAR